MTMKAKALRGFLGNDGRVRRNEVFEVDQTEFDRLKALGLVEATKGERLKVQDDLDARSVDDLIELAKASEIDLGDAKKKADIISLIRTHRAKG